VSLIYRLDPRTKIILVSLLTILIFIVNSFPVTAGLMLFILVFRIVQKVPFSGVKTFIFFAMTVTILVLVQFFFGYGLVHGLFIGCRFVSLLLLLPLLTKTATPEKIATGLCALGINYRIGFIITTALNMIPFFEGQASLIMDAQKLRGMHLFQRKTRFFGRKLPESCYFWSKLKAYPGLVVPLVLGAMRKAQVVSVAMDSRAFGVYKSRTWLDKPQMKTCDYVSITVCALFSAFALYANFFIKWDIPQL
jgi:energy-coupling factor transport system permease protein